VRLKICDVVAPAPSRAAAASGRGHPALVWRGELALRRKGGRQIPVEAHVAAVTGPTGTRSVWVVRDIATRRAAAAERRAAAAHDLRNAMTVAQGQLQLLQRRLGQGTLAPPGLETGLPRLGAALGRMGQVLDELLEVADPCAGPAPLLRPASTDLTRLAREAVAARRAATEGHRWVVDAPAPVVGRWDAARLARVLDNLLANAVKYSPAGGTVRVTVTGETDAAGLWAVVAVADEGVGIPAADLPRVGTWGWRGGNVAGRIAGSGIGLAGARALVAAHGGTLAIDSTEGRGTTVTVRLPAEVGGWWAPRAGPRAGAAAFRRGQRGGSGHDR